VRELMHNWIEEHLDSPFPPLREKRWWAQAMYPGEYDITMDEALEALECHLDVGRRTWIKDLQEDQRICDENNGDPEVNKLDIVKKNQILAL